MKILHVIPTFVPAYRYGGPVRSVDGLARAQAALGHDVSVFTTNADGEGVLDVPTDRAVERQGVEVRYFPVGHPRRLGRSPQLGEALAARVTEFDVLHLHSIFLWPTWAAAREARRQGVPYFVSPRGMLVANLIRRRGGTRKRLWIAFFEKRTLRQAAGILVTSNLEKREIEGLGLDLAPISVVANGVDLRELEPQSDERASPKLDATLNRQPLVLYLGRLSWKKGLDRLIDALRAVEHFHLVLAGPDDEELGPTLESLASRVGVRDRVEILGPVEGTDRKALLHAARIFVLPSTSENFGLAALEAMAVGCPVVVTVGVGLAEEIEAAGAGLVVEPDPSGLAKALTAFAEDADRARAAGARGRELVRRRFTWPNLARQSIEIYEENRKRPREFDVAMEAAP